MDASESLPPEIPCSVYDRIAIGVNIEGNYFQKGVTRGTRGGDDKGGLEDGERSHGQPRTWNTC